MKVDRDQILLSDVDNYKAGNISQYLYNWSKIATDSIILDIVRNGLKMDFIHKPPTQTKDNYDPVSILEQSIIDEEIAQLLQKKVIVETTQEPDDFISPVFTRVKKMAQMLGVWIAKVDLKNAFFH